MFSIEEYRNAFLAHMKLRIQESEPKNLYEPITYILGLGGKRLRPILTLMAADMFANDHKDALDAALAIEVFHNFSLVHDDIMDEAPLRRGNPSVHKKWNINSGILSGDAMLIMAYQLLEGYGPGLHHKLSHLFGKTALQVCEGQQMYMDFETQEKVPLSRYMTMIEYKTAVLLATALQMGALVGRASEKDQQSLYDFGRNLGLAFQLQDDYLDAFGDPITFGKQVGGDIIENKKTYLYITALEKGSEPQKKELLALFSSKPKNPAKKVDRVLDLYHSTGASELIKSEIKTYTLNAFDTLEALNIPPEKKEGIHSLGRNLMGRAQ
ncbi:MAG: polyprenyl synthetase family protein [Flavobacteriaceae bacterium]